MNSRPRSGPRAAPANVVTLVVVQTPVFGIRPIEEVQGIHDAFVAFEVDAEAWSLSKNGFHLMLARLANRNPMTVLLSGDVHYSFVAAVDYFASHAWGETTARQLNARIVQLNSSGLKNEATKTRALHAAGGGIFRQPIERNPRTFLGFGTPKNIVYYPPSPPTAHGYPAPSQPVPLNETPLELPLDEWGTRYASASGPLPASDWMYRVEFLTGTKVPPGETAAGAPIQILDPTPVSRVTRLSDWLNKLGRSYHAAVGTMVVGVNNLATVTFTGDGARRLARPPAGCLASDRRHAHGDAAGNDDL